MDTWYSCHTRKLTVLDDDLRRLWRDDRIAIHFPDAMAEGDADNAQVDPDKYQDPDARRGMACLAKIALHGAYVWTESRITSDAKVGIVQPGSTIELAKATWGLSTWPELAHREGSVAMLKTLKLDRIRVVEKGAMPALRAGRPRHKTLSPWHRAGTRVADLVEGRKPRMTWSVLEPERQEIACAEFLRHQESLPFPRMKHQLMRLGGTAPDIDILGLDESGNELIAQVTFLREEKIGDKIRALQAYLGAGKRAILFCQASERKVVEGVDIVPVAEVIKWLKVNKAFTRRLFTA